MLLPHFGVQSYKVFLRWQNFFVIIFEENCFDDALWVILIGLSNFNNRFKAKFTQNLAAKIKSGNFTK